MKETVDTLATIYAFNFKTGVPKSKKLCLYESIQWPSQRLTKRIPSHWVF